MKRIILIILNVSEPQKLARTNERTNRSSAHNVSFKHGFFFNVITFGVIDLCINFRKITTSWG